MDMAIPTSEVTMDPVRVQPWVGDLLPIVACLLALPLKSGSFSGLDGAGLTGERLRLDRHRATLRHHFHPLPA